MKHKMTVITDKNGAFLGAVRNGTIQDGENMLQFSASPHPDHRHHNIEVDEEVIRRPFDEVRDLLLRETSGKQ
jgi:hypothetical protein